MPAAPAPPFAAPIRPRRGTILVEALAALVVAAAVVLPVLALIARAAPVAADAQRARRLVRATAAMHARLASAGCTAPDVAGTAEWPGATATWHAHAGGGARRTQLSVRGARGEVRRTDRSVPCD